MRRREFITLIGGVGAVWPLAARAQQQQPRRVGILMSVAKDATTEHRITTFQRELQNLGWTTGANLRIDVRWGGGELDAIREGASELVAFGPNVILANGGVPVQVLRRAIPSVPIVFVGIIDPVGQGIVESLGRPGANITGFALFEFSMCGKWVELLRQIIPRLQRIGVLRDPTDLGGGTAQYAIVQATAQSYGLESSPIDTSNASAIESGIATLAGGSGRGLIVTTGQSSTVHRELIISLGVKHRLPAVYPLRFFADGGGLISYGPDLIDQYKRAAGYVDRILKGEKPADLPVQVPTKYELVINLKTAKMLDVTVPPTLLATVDEVIE